MAIRPGFLSCSSSHHACTGAGNPGSEEHWWDLCAGPHVTATGDIAPDALDLESVAGLLVVMLYCAQVGFTAACHSHALLVTWEGCVCRCLLARR